MDDLFGSIIEQAYTTDFKAYENPHYHFFSLKHRRKMKQLINNNSEVNSVKTDIRIKKKLPAVAVALIIILSMLITAAGATLFIHGFGLKKESDHTLAFPTDIENAPTTIEYAYSPSYIPDGFKKLICDTDEMSFNHYYRKDKDIISITQHSKPDLTAHYNTEGYDIEIVNINGHEGFKIDYNTNGRIYVWDDGDYIFDIYSTLSDDEILKIAGGLK